MKMKNLCLAILALALLATPALAQKGRSNKDGAARGNARADLVQTENESPDKDRDRNADNDKNRGKHKGETKGKHKAKGSATKNNPQRTTWNSETSKPLPLRPVSSSERCTSKICLLPAPIT